MLYFPFPFVVFGGAGAWRGQAGCSHAEIFLFTKVVWISSEFPGVCKCSFVQNCNFFFSSLFCISFFSCSEEKQQCLPVSLDYIYFFRR